MKYRVVFSPEADHQLVELFCYIAGAASPDTAKRYTDAIVEFCEELSTYPIRGTDRGDVRSGLRTISYKKRVLIAFSVDHDAASVSIIGLFYGGQDFETILQNEILPDFDVEY